jgi:hypothetical protein
MGALGIGLLTFVCLFAGVFVGISLRRALPERRLNEESRHVIEISLGIIGTMAGVVLGLLLASATGSRDNLENQVKATAAGVLQLDRILSRYGTGADPARATLRFDIAQAIRSAWPQDARATDPSDNPQRVSNVDLLGQIAALVPQTERQRTLKPAAVSAAIALGQVRWLIVEQVGSAVSTPLLVLLIFWFTATFTGLGLLAPLNRVVLFTMGLSVISISSAVFIMIALYEPFRGVLEISSAPLHEALKLLAH